MSRSSSAPSHFLLDIPQLLPCLPRSSLLLLLLPLYLSTHTDADRDKHGVKEGESPSISNLEERQREL